MSDRDYKSHDILLAACTVQSELETLLGAEASQVALKLAQLIADVEAGKEDSFKLKDFLAEYDSTRSRMAELLKSRPGRPCPERPRSNPLLSLSEK